MLYDVFVRRYQAVISPCYQAPDNLRFYDYCIISETWIATLFSQNVVQISSSLNFSVNYP